MPQRLGGSELGVTDEPGECVAARVADDRGDVPTFIADQHSRRLAREDDLSPDPLERRSDGLAVAHVRVLTAGLQPHEVHESDGALVPALEEAIERFGGDVETHVRDTNAMRHLKKNVFITGAGSGFGRATARGFAREGADTVVLVERLEDRLQAAADEISHLGSRAVPILADLGDVAACQRALDEALAAAPKLDVLVSNHAAMAWFTPFLEVEDGLWDETMAVNLTSHFVLGRRAANAMAETGGGVILYTASVNAMGAGRGFAPYCVSKAGIVALVRVMAVELAPLGIRVNCVSPGPADTQRSVELVGEEKMDEFRRRFQSVPMNRLASVEDVAEAFLYLASDAAAYVTGHNLVIDGGLTAQLYDVPE